MKKKRRSTADEYNLDNPGNNMRYRQPIDLVNALYRIMDGRDARSRACRQRGLALAVPAERRGALVPKLPGIRGGAAAPPGQPGIAREDGRGGKGVRAPRVFMGERREETV